MSGIYYTLYNLIGGVLYETLPQAQTFEAMALAFLSTFISFIVVLLPFFFAFWVLKKIFSIFSWGN